MDYNLCKFDGNEWNGLVIVCNAKQFYEIGKLFSDFASLWSFLTIAITTMRHCKHFSADFNYVHQDNLSCKLHFATYRGAENTASTSPPSLYL